MEALAFNLLPDSRPPKLPDRAESRLCRKALHPSEDGEALPIETLRSLPIEGDPLRDGALGDVPSTSWFAVYTTCRHEKRVAQHLGQREINFYLPLYRSERKWRDGSKVTLELPLFPCYIFVYIQRSARVHVLNVPGALAIVGGTGGQPAPLPDSAIDALRSGLQQRRIEPHPLLTVGQRARIRTGAFAGMDGVVVRRKSGFRVVLTLQQISQSIAVEVDEGDLELLEAAMHKPVGLAGLNPLFCSQ
jgi:transcription antitermination factor NusG